MDDQHQWLLLDTETTGLKAPIFVVELAAQRMRGWRPEGPAFRKLLNHGVDIPPEASRVNGYTPEILERDGETPISVYEAFADYADQCPLVSYNLHYDLDQVLQPEWERLGIEPIGRAGFCALRLAQRLLDPFLAGNCKLQTLRQYYRLPERGAHTALGDVETVIDLLQDVLRPLAEAKGLSSWDALVSYSDTVWYPSRIAFGKYKGRSYRDALDDPGLYAWLEWLSESGNPRSSTMGKWYLERLHTPPDADEDESPLFAVDTSTVDSTGLVAYLHPELETLKQLIAGARNRLADLEAEYTETHQAVAVVKARIFTVLRSYYEQRDELLLKLKYLRQYLDALLIEGEEEAERVKPEFEHARAETEREYEEAASEASTREKLSEEERNELKKHWRKLVGLFHPDRYAHDPEQQIGYERLVQAVNQAKDAGDIELLREIAEDPNDFMQRRGWGSLDFSDEAEVIKLRKLYDSLQARILTILEELSNLRESSDYELYRLCEERSAFFDEIVEQTSEELTAEIADLKAEAEGFLAEIEGLTGVADPFITS